jgi:hypothetical protein
VNEGAHREGDETRARLVESASHSCQYRPSLPVFPCSRAPWLLRCQPPTKPRAASKQISPRLQNTAINTAPLYHTPCSHTPLRHGALARVLVVFVLFVSSSFVACWVPWRLAVGAPCWRRAGWRRRSGGPVTSLRRHTDTGHGPSPPFPLASLFLLCPCAVALSKGGEEGRLARCAGAAAARSEGKGKGKATPQDAHSTKDKQRTRKQPKQHARRKNREHNTVSSASSPSE